MLKSLLPGSIPCNRWECSNQAIDKGGDQAFLGRSRARLQRHRAHLRGPQRTRLPSPGRAEWPTPSDLIAAAHEIRTIAKSLSLTIIDLQPFSQYEGLRSRSDHKKALEKEKLWFQLAHALDLILISSSMLPASECTSDLPTIIRDMTQLADLAREQVSKTLTHPPGIREPRVWHENRYMGGACRGLGASDNGKTADGEMVLADSLKKMVESVDVEKILLIQVADVERVSPPISPEQNEQTGQLT
ncbi:unnamed protein product [Calypogeia fissa]